VAFYDLARVRASIKSLCFLADFAHAVDCLEKFVWVLKAGRCEAEYCSLSQVTLSYSRSFAQSMQKGVVGTIMRLS
jgi:hypothetical protein